MKKISLGEAFSSGFNTPNKWTTIMLICVCFLIPVVGPLVIMGYLVRRFVNERRGEPAADFNFDFFGEYLKIGLWPFLVSLVLSFAITPLFFLCYLPMIGIAADPENEALIAICLVATVILFIVIILLMTLISYPMMLRSALTQSFGEGFNFRWIMSFIKKVGGQLLLWGIVLMLISIPMVLVGYLALFIGVYVAMAILTVVSYHLMFQLYDLFIEKGGEPIAIHPDVVGAPPAAHPPMGIPNQPPQQQGPPPSDLPPNT